MTSLPDAALWAPGLGLLGTIIGSFVAALVIRWPAGRSVLWGRSACDACGRTLTAAELVPVLSYMALRGRCHGCGAAIDHRHLVIELLGALIGAAAGLASPGVEALAGAAFGWLLLALGALDIAAMWLPDRLTVPLALGGIGVGLAGFVPGIHDRILGGCTGYLALQVIAWGYRRFRGREGMGGGDPKLLGAIGLWLGWRMLPGVLLLASLMGLGVAASMALRGRPVARDTALPLGTLLAAAAYPAWLAMLWLAP